MSELSQLIAGFLLDGVEVTVTVTGSSMLPLLHHRRDTVCIVKAQEKCLKKYDIVLYVRKDGSYILHRIISVKADGYEIAGDHQVVEECHILPSQVLGVVKGFWRDGNYISCDNFWYRVYYRFWFFGYPVRRVYLRVKKILDRLILLSREKTGARR